MLPCQPYLKIGTNDLYLGTNHLYISSHHLYLVKTKELMHCHCGTNNRAPCKPEVRPGAREESTSPAWLAASAMNARDTTKVYIWRLDTGCGPTLYRKCHSHNTPGKRHNNTWVEPLAGNCTTSSTRLGTKNDLKLGTNDLKIEVSCLAYIVFMTCPSCHENYIGQTGNSLCERVRVHKQQIQHPNLRQIPLSGHLDQCANGTFKIFPFLKNFRTDTKYRKKRWNRNSYGNFKPNWTLCN